MAKSCTCRQLSYADYLLGYTICSRSTALMIAATAQNTNNTTIRSEGKLVHLEQPLAPLPYPVVSQAARDAYDALLDAQNEVACLMFGRRMSVSKLLSFEDENLLGHNYNMHSMGKMLAELHAMLKLHEKGIPKKAKTPIMLAIREGRIQKD
ncbi:hypothetical protein Tco_0904890, partial [Tanacetum coccineum]